MSEIFDGVDWLERLADRYESVARRLRDTALMVKEFEALTVEANHGTESVTISEAIRRVLTRDRPQPARVIYNQIISQNIRVRTRSKDLKNLIQTTLGSMTRANQLRRVEDGWILP